MDFSPTPNLIVRKDGRVGRLLFNQPEKRNAVSLDMWTAIPAILDALESDPEIRVLVVSGAGGKAFISGADISEFDAVRAAPEQAAHYDKVGELAMQRLAGFAKPTIAQIGGDCIGGGVAVALRCDIRIASDRARFAVPAAKLGLGYAVSGVKYLVDIVGPAFTREILFTGRLFDAAEALAMGLVNRLVPDAELDASVEDYCQRIADNAPLTIHAARRAIEELIRADGEADLGAVDALVQRCFASEDYVEGRAAFMEKRKPRFRGR